MVLATGDSEVGKPTADEGSESESSQIAKRGICQVPTEWTAEPINMSLAFVQNLLRIGACDTWLEL